MKGKVRSYLVYSLVYLNHSSCSRLTRLHEIWVGLFLSATRMDLQAGVQLLEYSVTVSIAVSITVSKSVLRSWNWNVL